MGIAVKTYLDDFLNVEESKEARRAARVEYGQKYLPKGINISEGKSDVLESEIYYIVLSYE